MKGFDKSMVVVAGLAATLSLGMVGCSSGSKANTAGQTSAAATTTASEGTTMSSASGAPTTTSASGDSVSGGLDQIAYANASFGFAYKTPEGFGQYMKDSGTDGAELVYYSTNDAGSEVYILGYKDINSLEGVSDEASWGKFYSDAQVAEMQAEGETDIVVKTGSATVGDGTKMTAIRIDSKKGDMAIYREIFLTLDSEGNGMTILFITDNEETLKLMEGGIGSYLV